MSAATLEERVLLAARDRDTREFLALAKQMRGGLPAAQRLVRSNPLIRIQAGATVQLSGAPARSTTVAAGTPSVCITEKAWRAIRDEMGWTADGRETGGPLFGHVDRDGNVVVVAAAGTSYTSPRFRDRTTFEFDSDRARAIELTYPESEWWLGDWHTHPGAEEARASPPDLRGWAGMFREAVGAYAGVIVPQNHRSNARAWVVTATDRAGQAAELKWETAS